MPATLTDDHLNQPIAQFARTNVIRIGVDQTVEEALETIRGSGDGTGRIIYFYVLDDEERLQGIVPTRRLLLSSPATRVREIMDQRVVAVPSTATLLDACDLFLFHRFLALPVVDEQKRLLGVVDVELYTDELSDLARRTEHDDLFQLIGVHVNSVRKASAGVVFRNRFPWLVCNVAGGLACALIAGWFEPVLNRALALALFIPVVLALAESVSIQSLTLTLQSQHGRPVKGKALLLGLLRETPIGMLLGLSCGLLVAIASWVWQGEPGVAGSLLLSILLSITLATLFGLLVPSLLKAIQRDPKVASGPITLALTDLATLTTYFSIASWLL